MNKGSLASVTPTCLAVMFATIAQAGCGAPPDSAGEMRVDATMLVPDSVVRSGPVPEPGKAWELFRAVDLASLDDSLLISDSGNDRVVVLDGVLHFAREMGQEGSGPGEYRAPFGVRWTGRDIVVSDLGNGRLTWLSRGGDARRVLPMSPVPQSFGFLENGTLLLPGRSATHYLERVEGDVREPFAERRDVLAGEGLRSAQHGGLDPWIAVTAGDTVHLFEDATGALLKIAPDGTLRMTRTLPRPFLDSMLVRRAKRVEGFRRQGLRVWSPPLAKSLTVTDDGRLLLLVRNGSTAGLVIDPRTYIATRIVAPRSAQWALLLNASRAILRGRLLTAIVADSVIEFRLSPRPGG